MRIIYIDDPEFETLFKAGKVAVGSGPLQFQVAEGLAMGRAQEVPSPAPAPSGRALSEAEIAMALIEDVEGRGEPSGGQHRSTPRCKAPRINRR